MTENRVVERARTQRDAGAAVAQPDKVEAAIAARPSISDEQAAMVRHLTTSGAGIDVTVGAAGTGKTFTFDAAPEGWEASGYSVFGAAFSARAAAELSARSGIPAMTITRLLNQLDEGRLVLDAGCVVVIVMIASRRADVADLNDRARALLDAAGRFGNHELHIDKRILVAGREFAVGDQVLAIGRNHWDLDILNGDVGIVTRINKSRKTVTFHCERVDAERTMPTDRLEAGFLDHSYARTIYKTQGATAGRIFTLGGDGDLDRQGAYSALSRGRVENRLYMCTPDEGVWGLLAPKPHRVEGREVLLEHAERELSRDRSQHLARELLDNLPEPDGTPVGVGRDALLADLPEPDRQGAHRTLADELLADLPDRVGVEEDLAEQVAKVTARLDRLQQRELPTVDDGIVIDL